VGAGETPLARDDPRRLATRVLGREGETATGIPPDGGHFEVTRPAVFLRGNRAADRRVGRLLPPAGADALRPAPGRTETGPGRRPAYSATRNPDAPATARS
jgi:hypothetical protein